jgi:hypothetical protein
MMSVAEFPEQMLMVWGRILKFDRVTLVIPAPPLVAPFGGNSVSADEFVVPFVPPLALRTGDPDDTEM